ENYISENYKRLIFEFRTGIQPTGMRIEKNESIRFLGSDLEKIKLKKTLDWMNEFLPDNSFLKSWLRPYRLGRRKNEQFDKSL
ncbi:hypothetical protein JQ310_19515, partial [Leptospira interrogans]|nr:hypothetical protein [Leptospira interrogans]